MRLAKGGVCVPVWKKDAARISAWTIWTPAFPLGEGELPLHFKEWSLRLCWREPDVNEWSLCLKEWAMRVLTLYILINRYMSSDTFCILWYGSALLYHPASCLVWPRVKSIGIVSYDTALLFYVTLRVPGVAQRNSIGLCFVWYRALLF